MHVSVLHLVFEPAAFSARPRLGRYRSLKNVRVALDDFYNALRD